MSLNRCIPFCCNICHFAADYALKPPYFNTCADSKGGGNFRKGGGGGKSPLSPPPPPPLYESLQVVSGMRAALSIHDEQFTPLPVEVENTESGKREIIDLQKGTFTE